MKSINIKFIFAPFVLSALSISLMAQLTWKKTNGPEGGTILCIEKADNLIFAGTFGTGILASSDNGESWKEMNSGLFYPTGMIVLSLSYNSANKRIFAGTYNGIYYSDNNGQSWTHLPQTSSYNVSCFYKASNGVYYAGCTPSSSAPRAILRSTDNGLTWSNVFTPGGGVWSFVEWNGELLCTSFNIGFYRSTNGGTSWQYVNAPTFLPSIQKAFWQITLDKMGNVYAATATDGIYFSSDKGNTWSKNSSAISIRNFRYVISTPNGDTIYASTFDGLVYKSTVGTNTWTRVFNMPKGNYNNNLIVAIRAIDNNKIILGSATNYGVFLSNDGGNTWSKKSTGLNLAKINCITTIGESNIVVGADQNLFLSKDTGNTWIAPSSNFEGSRFVEFKKKNNEIYALYNYELNSVINIGISKSNNNGETWTSVSNLTGRARTFSVLSNGYIIIGENNLLKISKNNGSSYSDINLLNLPLTQYSFITNKITIDKSDNIYIALDIIPVGQNSTVIGRSTIFKSTDLGNTFNEISSIASVTDKKTAKDLAVVGSKIYYCTTDGNNGIIFLSKDNGSTWSTITISNTKGVQKIIFPPDSSYVISTLDSGILVSKDSGTTWNQINSGRPYKSSSVLEMNDNFELFSDIFFANPTTGSGLYRSTPILKRSSSNNNNNSDILIYPNPFSSSLNIRTTTDYNNKAFFITDMIGRKVYVGLFNNTTTYLNLGYLASGMYILHTINNGQKKSLKFIKIN